MADELEEDVVVLFDASAQPTGELINDGGKEVQEAGEEDVVVREIDVFWNPQLDEATQLKVLQYPLRPAWRPYEFDARTKIRVKPATSEIEIDWYLDVNSEHFDSEAASAQAFEKLTLSSKWEPLQRATYAIGLFTGKELHLNPVSEVRQLRPSFDHLNPSASEKKNLSKVATIATSSTGESSRNPNKALDQKDDEPWIPLNFHDFSSDISATYRMKMVAATRSPLVYTMKPLDYLDSLCRQDELDKMKLVAESERCMPSLPSDQHDERWTMSNESREALPIALRRLFEDHNACSFETICHDIRSMALNNRDDPILAAAALGLDAPQEEIKKIFNDVLYHIHDAYVLRSPLKNPELKPLRDAVIALLIGKGADAKVMKCEVIECAKTYFQMEPTDHEYRKVMRDLCEPSGSKWILKMG